MVSRGWGKVRMRIDSLWVIGFFEKDENENVLELDSDNGCTIL